ncbi:putative transporter [Trachipleistophora hominis]|uniref:Putative transporter n=1 Tax=Trachipleistophora hominis TaxID=72359 RepID=L7JXZ2_TRAHO|nr:putative transporter [Trachipleistophora hominis]
MSPCGMHTKKKIVSFKKSSTIEVLLTFMLSLVDFVIIYLVYQMVSRQSHIIFVLFTVTLAYICLIYDREQNLILIFMVLLMGAIVYNMDTYTTFGSAPIDEIFESFMVEKKQNYAILAVVSIIFRILFADFLIAHHAVSYTVYLLLFSIFAFVTTANELYRLTITYTQIYIVIGAVLSGIMHATTDLCDFGSLDRVLLVYAAITVFITLYLLDSNGYVIIKNPQEMVYPLPSKPIIFFITANMAIPFLYPVFAHFFL